jgi:hypothetical protein
MTRDEYLAVLATEPATANQRGAIMAEFERLGFGDGDRAERLAICAALLGLGELGSTGDLLMGQAGQLVGVLRGIRDRGELLHGAAAAGGDDQADEPGRDTRTDDGQGGNERMTWPEAIARIVAMIYAACQGKGIPSDGR